MGIEVSRCYLCCHAVVHRLDRIDQVNGLDGIYSSGDYDGRQVHSELEVLGMNGMHAVSGRPPEAKALLGFLPLTMKGIF